MLEGISAHTDEAVAQDIVDLEADDLDELLAAVDGRKVSTQSLLDAFRERRRARRK